MTARPRFAVVQAVPDPDPVELARTVAELRMRRLFGEIDEAEATIRRAKRQLTQQALRWCDAQGLKMVPNHDTLRATLQIERRR